MQDHNVLANADKKVLENSRQVVFIFFLEQIRIVQRAEIYNLEKELASDV